MRVLGKGQGLCDRGRGGMQPTLNNRRNVPATATPSPKTAAQTPSRLPIERVAPIPDETLLPLAAERGPRQQPARLPMSRHGVGPGDRWLAWASVPE